MATRTRANFKATKNSRYVDNTTGLISAANGRDALEDVADSCLFWEDDVTEDNTLAGASNNTVPTSLAVKTYVDNSIAGGAGAISGSLTSGRVPVASGAGSLTDYNTFKFDGTKLAIGNVTPDSLLHVWASSAGSVNAPTNTIVTVERNGDAYISILTPDANERGIFFGEASDNDVAAIFYNTAAVPDGYEIRGNGATRVYITSAGKVGIGGSPTYELDVFGTGSTTGRVTTSGNAAPALVVSRTGASSPAEWIAYIPTGGTNLILNNGADRFQFLAGTTTSEFRVNASSGHEPFIELTEANSRTSGQYWDIYKSTSHDLKFFNGSDRLSVSAAGVVRIHTTPSTDNSGTVLAIDGSGNVVKRTDLIDGSGASGRVPYFSDSNTLTSESVFAYNETTNTLSVGALTLSIGAVTSGTYTPTATNVSNVSSSTPGLAQYIQVGTVITLSGTISVDSVSTSTDSQVRISLPVTGTVNALSGAGWHDTLLSDIVVVVSTTSNEALLTFNSGSNVTNPLVVGYTLTYSLSPP
jgi:hypothetical protein